MPHRPHLQHWHVRDFLRRLAHREPDHTHRWVYAHAGGAYGQHGGYTERCSVCGEKRHQPG